MIDVTATRSQLMIQRVDNDDDDEMEPVHS